MYEEHTVEGLGRRDELMVRVAAADPAASLGPLSDGTLARVTRHAMVPTPRLWSRRRFRFASLGALATSGGLVLAGVLGIEAASPGLPVLALGRIPQSSVATQYATSDAPVAAQPFVHFSFQSVQALNSSQKTVTAYHLMSSEGAAAAASTLAAAFHVRGEVVRQTSGAFRIGVASGPSVTTWTSSGVVEWSYRNAASGTMLGMQGGLSFTTASVHAMSLLTRLDLRSDAGVPVGARSDTGVEVFVPLVVGHKATDQIDELAYGQGDAVESARGVFATALAGPAYPTISARQAVGVLRADHGFVVYGGIAPLAATSLPAVYGSPTQSSTHSKNGIGAYGSESGPPARIVVDIEHATLRYATYVLDNGTSWLLPTWWLSGTEHGAGVPTRTRYSAYVLAVTPSSYGCSPVPRHPEQPSVRSGRGHEASSDRRGTGVARRRRSRTRAVVRRDLPRVRGVRCVAVRRGPRRVAHPPSVRGPHRILSRSHRPLASAAVVFARGTGTLRAACGPRRLHPRTA